jgi:hypothetical protein
MLSTMPVNDLRISVCPDSDKVGVCPGRAKRLRTTGSGDYRGGEL